jgi:hypothetical protein
LAYLLLEDRSNGWERTAPGRGRASGTEVTRAALAAANVVYMVGSHG